MELVEYQRTPSILRKKFLLYMVPAVLTAIGASLSEFVDCMVVSHLLNSDAFAVVNLGTPIVFMVSTLYTITGVGGSLLFAEYLGRKDRANADNCFTIATAFALLAGIILLAVFLCVQPLLGDLFGCPAELREMFDTYTSVLRLFVPLGILFMHFSYFLPIIGRPFQATGLVILVNVLNITMDYVYIRIFGMGCEGAAAATLTAYAVGTLATLLIWRFSDVPLTICKPHNIGRTVMGIVKKGIPDAGVQIGYLVTVVFCNQYMNMAFGLHGVVAMSLFSQLDSIVSIALCGITNNDASFVAMLKGEGDYYGIRSLIKRVAIMVFAACSVLALLFAAFPQQVAGVFNIHDADTLKLVVPLMRIYAPYYPLRCILLVLKDIYNALDRAMYASALGIIDKAVSIPLLGSILYPVFGGYGIIMSFPLGIILIHCLIVIVNHRIVKKSNGRYSPILLLDEEYPLKALCGYSVRSLKDVEGIATYIAGSISKTSLPARTLHRICLAAEEISLYVIDQCGQDTSADYLISTNGSEFILTCRNPGEPFYPIKEKEGDLSPNELLLREMFKIKHEYIFGLNSTSLTIAA